MLPRNAAAMARMQMDDFMACRIWELRKLRRPIACSIQNPGKKISSQIPKRKTQSKRSKDGRTWNPDSLTSSFSVCSAYSVVPHLPVWAQSITKLTPLPPADHARSTADPQLPPRCRAFSSRHSCAWARSDSGFARTCSPQKPDSPPLRCR